MEHTAGGRLLKRSRPLGLVVIALILYVIAWAVAAALGVRPPLVAGASVIFALGLAIGILIGSESKP